MQKQVHDIVRLNSGGPDMTIIDNVQDGWLCIWLDDVGSKQHYVFKDPCLTLIERSKS